MTLATLDRKADRAFAALDRHLLQCKHCRKGEFCDVEAKLRGAYQDAEDGVWTALIARTPELV